MAQDVSPVYEFGPFRLEVGERRLFRGADRVPLTGKVFETLRVLVERPGRLLTKEELIRTVWPDAIVEDNNLNHNISVLRRALGGDGPKNAFIETVPRVGYRFVAEVRRSGAEARPVAPAADPTAATTRRQVVRFCTSADGTRIAYSAVGSGPPLVKTSNWINHLEYEWESPVWKHWIDEMSRRHLFVRYDGRGCGLSDAVLKDLSFEAWVADQEAVIDALGLDRFALLGISQGGAVAVAYAARHPERVTHLILYGAYGRGSDFRGDKAAKEAREALIRLTRLGWGKDNEAFRQIFTKRFFPDADARETEWFSDLQRISASPENAARFMEQSARLDVRPLLAAIRVPTIVFHREHDGAVPFDEGRLLAASIPGAKFVPLPGRNHLPLEREPAWPALLGALGSFLGWEARSER